MCVSPPLITLEGERRRSESRALVQSERASIARSRGSPHYIPSRRVIPREGRKHIVAFCQSHVSEFRRSFVCWLRSPLGFFCFPFVSCFLLRRLIFIFLNQVSPSFLSLGLVPALKLSSFICCLGIRFFFSLFLLFFHCLRFRAGVCACVCFGILIPIGWLSTKARRGTNASPLSFRSPRLFTFSSPSVVSFFAHTVFLLYNTETEGRGGKIKTRRSEGIKKA